MSRSAFGQAHHPGGLALPKSVQPCPKITPGPGRVVMMKSTTRYRGEMAKLTLEGVQTPIVGTLGHPIYSEDREGFVPLGDLEIGEAVRTAEGWAIVESLARMWSEGTTVHNLEVEGEHRFLVGSAGVVSHNVSSRLLKNSE